MTWQRWEYTLFGRKRRTNSARQLARIAIAELYRRDPEGVRQCAEQGLFRWLGTRARLGDRSGAKEYFGEDLVVVLAGAGEKMILGDLPTLFRKLWFREDAFVARLLDE